MADQIYRTRENRSFCKENGIRLSGPKLGRLNPVTNKTDKKLEYQDHTDRIGTYPLGLMVNTYCVLMF